MALRRTSRLTVDGARPSSAAISRIPASSRSRSAMRIRSSSVRYLDGPEAGAVRLAGGTGFLPAPGEPCPLRHLLPVR